MIVENYLRIITVRNSPDAAYEALTVGIENWWTKPDAPLSILGNNARFTFPPNKSLWTFEATVLKPQERVEMLCVEALHLHDGLPKEIKREWLGTTVIWQITPNGENTKIQLEHVGLIPSLHCFDICQTGWDFFFAKSLQSYLDTGIGMPHQ